MRSGLPYLANHRWFEWKHPRDILLDQIAKHLGALRNVDSIAVLYTEEDGDATQRELMQSSDGSLWNAYYADGRTQTSPEFTAAPQTFALSDEIKQLYREHSRSRISLPWDYLRSSAMVLFIATPYTRKWIAGQIRSSNYPSSSALDRIIDALLVVQEPPSEPTLSEELLDVAARPAVILRIVWCAHNFDESTSYLVAAEEIIGCPGEIGTKFTDDQDGSVWILTGWSFGIVEHLGMHFSPQDKNRVPLAGMILTEIKE